MPHLASHCELCDHQQFDLKIGTTCALTDRKPEFNKTCSKIELNDKFETQLKDINITYDQLKRKKALTIAYFVVMVFVGIAIITSAFLLGKYALGNRVVSAVPIIIMGVSLGPFVMGFGTLNSYLQELRVAKSKKERIDKILDLYNIKYDLDIQFGKSYHGTQEAAVHLNIKK
ncbi:hypothetical protein [Aquimarina brevivitae]|uniref:Uncharacterized protein n=1 Tax=Aquimarina brevivitae TaxID=323412 RepID=A0A4Q7NY70_9FLAO|nr:hypothetical protein [Aquimarina brevivitae]RZS91898.1 hypothetical protein EV197_3002 [Aquimarina brevivitae]